MYKNEGSCYCNSVLLLEVSLVAVVSRHRFHCNGKFDRIQSVG